MTMRSGIRCKRTGCIYHMPAESYYGCNYAACTGHTRLAQLPPNKQGPSVCPLYKRGRRKHAIALAVLPETAGGGKR